MRENAFLSPSDVNSPLARQTGPRYAQQQQQWQHQQQHQRHASVLAVPPAQEFPSPKSTPYANLTIGVPRETYPSERRVALTPTSATQLLKRGFARILLERGAGELSQFPDTAYEAVGVTVVSRDDVYKSADILLKVRAPSTAGTGAEVQRLRAGQTVIAFLYPAQNREKMEMLASRGITAFGMDMIPRISRAQVFDALR